MEFTIKTGAPEKLKTSCLVVGVLDGERLAPPAADLDKAAGGALASILATGDLGAKAGATLLVHNIPGVAAPRLLLVSLGKADALGEKVYRDALSGAAKALEIGRAHV